MTAPAKILLVDDQPVNMRALHQACLEEYEVFMATSGEQALEIARSMAPDLILLDVVMPGMDGLEVCRLLKSEPRTCAIPVIFVTFRDSPSQETACLQAGAVDFIPRPLNPAVVRARVKTQLNLKRQADRLLQGQELVANILDTAGAMIVLLDTAGRILRFNRECERVSGYTAAEVTGAVLWDRLIAPDEAPQVRAQFERAREGAQTNVHQNHWRTSSGEFRYIQWRAAVVRDATGRVEHLVATGMDLTESKAQEARLQLAASVYEHISEGILTTTADGTIVSANPAYCTVTGYAVEELVGNNPRIIKSDRHDPDFYKGMWRALLTKGSWEGEIWNRRKNGELFLARETITAIRDSRGRITNFVSLFIDITDARAREDLMRHQAFHDGLTGLPNRALFLDRLDRAVSLARRGGHLAALMFLDLDRFKEINDRLGHDAGDAFLKVAAQRLRASVRDSDTVARLGGDEFTLVLGHLQDPVHMHRIVQKVLQTLAEPFEISDQPLVISASVGIAMYPSDATVAEGLIKCADNAMYRVKQGGRCGYALYSSPQVWTTSPNQLQ